MMTSFDPFPIGPDGQRTVFSYSLAERDRRYTRVRQLMEIWDLDVIITPEADTWDTQAATAYLSQMVGVRGVQRGGWVVFPAVGEPTAILQFPRELDMWKPHLQWPSDLRWGDMHLLVIDRIRELGLAQGRIGVAGLRGAIFRPDGSIPGAVWDRIVRALPEATFIPADAVLDRARAVKGPEEIAVLEFVNEANEAALAKMTEIARPGLLESELWLAMSDVLTHRTYEYPHRVSLGSNNRLPNSSNGLPIPFVMQDGGVLKQEIEGQFRGYYTQANHAVLIGRRNEDSYRRAMEATIAIWTEAYESIRPGRTVGDLLSAFERATMRYQGKPRGMAFHQAGLGHSRPTAGIGKFPGGFPGVPGDFEWEIEAGWVFTFKVDADFEHYDSTALIGDTFVVEAGGARRSGRRAIEPIVTG